MYPMAGNVADRTADPLAGNHTGPLPDVQPELSHVNGVEHHAVDLDPQDRAPLNLCHHSPSKMDRISDGWIAPTSHRPPSESGPVHSHASDRNRDRMRACAISVSVDPARDSRSTVTPANVCVTAMILSSTNISTCATTAPSGA